jgi:peptidoglycan/xylan/chitin deacetylase (PgdA/CDA1 family)
VGLLTSVASQAASAADCPGHPDAIGTSRTIVVDPRAHPIIGTMQYNKTLPLGDREVVLTFDDGPLPKYSNQILDILAAHCAKATFFLVGSQAHANPEGVRKVRDAGHTVATHTQNHPTGMDRLPLDRSRQEIEQGIASVTAALADGTAPAPFLRIPGLRVNDGIEEFAASKGLQLWSADFPADDWRNVSANRVYELAIQRLEERAKASRAARHSAAHGRRAAEDPARTESARVSHRPCGAGDAGAAGDPDRAAAMAVASAVGDGGNIALAEDSEIRFCPSCGTSRPGVVRSRLAHDRSWRTRLAARARRSPALGCAVTAANDVAAGGYAGRAAGSGSEPFQARGIGADDPAGLVPARVGIDCAGPCNGSLLRKARRQSSPPRPRSRGPAAGVNRRNRARGAKRWRDHPQAGGASQTERAIGTGRRVEEALISGL